MSEVPIEPNSLPSLPALAVMLSLKPSSAAALACADASSDAALASSSARRLSNRATLSGVASVALPPGSR